ncbi:MAG: hypothetical protein HYU86_12190 [Chloroflexi bacterium]|nr:hypothetical protein [Chloroflexota bacterium]
MVSIPGIVTLPPIPTGHIKGVGLAKTAEQELRRQFIELFQPLALTKAQRTLEAELNKRTQEYLHLLSGVQRLINAYVPEARLVPFVLQSFEEASYLVTINAEILGSRERQILLLVLDDLRELLEASIENLRRDPGSLINVLLECAIPLLKGNMCLFTVLLVLEKEVKLWDGASIKLLCHMASKYMGEVEDVFLAHNKELGRRLDTSSPTISIDMVKQELKLSG